MLFLVNLSNLTTSQGLAWPIELLAGLHTDVISALLSHCRRLDGSQRADMILSASPAGSLY